VRAEAKLIADRVRAMEEEPRERVLRELRRCVDRLQASPLWSQEQPPVVPYRRLDLRCPLLGPDLRCTVYEDRPCGCRMHLARKPAEPFCSDDEHRPHQQFIMAGLYSQGPLVSLAVNGQAEYDHLIVLLAGELLGATLESGAARKFIVTRKHVSFPSPSTR
jgi:hypothetical protein